MDGEITTADWALSPAARDRRKETRTKSRRMESIYLFGFLGLFVVLVLVFGGGQAHRLFASLLNGLGI